MNRAGGSGIDGCFNGWEMVGQWCEHPRDRHVPRPLRRNAGEVLEFGPETPADTLDPSYGALGEWSAIDT